MRKMNIRRVSLILFLLLGIVLSSPACNRERFHKELETALVAHDWDSIQKAAESSFYNDSTVREVGILRGYAALIRNDTAAAVRQFVLARLGGNSRASSEQCEELAMRYPTNPILQLLAGDSLVRKGDLHRGLTKLDHALQLAPELGLARLSRATLQAMIGERKAALRDLDVLISRSPLTVEALVTRGLAHLEGGTLESALADLDRALETVPNHAIGRNARGLVYASKHDWGRAVLDFEAAFRSLPELLESKRNWQIAKKMMDQRGAFLTTQRSVTAYVTDLGINNWNKNLRMFDDFSQTRGGSIVPNLPRTGQILIPMPERMPETEAGKHMLKLEIARGIIDRIGAGTGSTFEIRLVQRVTTGGYFDPWRQTKVKGFTEISYGALASAKAVLSSKGIVVNMPAIVGSNGAFALTEILPKLGSNPIDRAVLVDGRAHVSSTVKTYNALGGRLSIINTAGDAPSLSGMIANHKTAKHLKESLPLLQVFWADKTRGMLPNDFLLTRHLEALKPSSSLFVKGVTGNGYTPVRQMTGWELITQGLGSTSQNNIPKPTQTNAHIERGGVELNTSQLVRKRDGRVSFGFGDKNNSGLVLVYTIFGSSKSIKSR